MGPRCATVYGMTSHPKKASARLLAALLLVAATAFATAQEIDPRARELLEGVGGAPTDEIRNMDVTTLTTITVEGQTISSGSRMVIDYENRRMVVISEAMGFESTIRIADGEATMLVMGMEMPAPPGTADDFEAMFDQGTNTNFLDAAESATFDGPVDYGGLLVGDQVTYVGDASLMNTPEATVMHYVFDANGAMLGAHMETGDGEMLMVFAEPVSGDAFAPAMDMSMYMLTDGAWQLFSTVEVQNVVIDGEIDESLFE